MQVELIKYSKQLYEGIKNPYIFVHQKASTNTINIVKWDINGNRNIEDN